MKCTIRMTAELVERTIRDLRRPHPFAGERIGFLHSRAADASAEGWILLPFDYVPVSDDQYLRDRTVGARICGVAIRTQMEAAMTGGLSVLHVHLHDFIGGVGFSRTDRQGYPPLLRSLRNASPSVPHGAIVLTPDSAYAEVLLPGAAIAESVGKVVFVGRPMRFIVPEGDLYG